MSKIDDGGPAFPRAASEDTGSGSCADGNTPEGAQPGMTVREYFAGKAMASHAAVSILATVL